MNTIRARLVAIGVLIGTGGVTLALRPDDDEARLVAVLSVGLACALPVVFARRPGGQPDATAVFSWRTILPGALGTVALHAVGNGHGHMTQLTAVLDLATASMLLARILQVRRDEPPP